MKIVVYYGVYKPPPYVPIASQINLAHSSIPVLEDPFQYYPVI